MDVSHSAWLHIDELNFSRPEQILSLKDKLLPDLCHGFFWSEENVDLNYFPTLIHHHVLENNLDQHFPQTRRSHDRDMAKACLLTKKFVLFLRKLAHLYKLMKSGRAIGGAYGWEHDSLNTCQWGSLPGEMVKVINPRIPQDKAVLVSLHMQIETLMLIMMYKSICSRRV